MTNLDFIQGHEKKRRTKSFDVKNQFASCSCGGAAERQYYKALTASITWERRPVCGIFWRKICALRCTKERKYAVQQY